MAVTYEWVVERLDYHGGDISDPDIVDTTAFDSLDDALAHSVTEGGTDGFLPPCRVVLVRNAGNNLDGLTDRQWAYVEDDGMDLSLPEYFVDSGEACGARVPVRYHQDLNRKDTASLRQPVLSRDVIARSEPQSE